MHFNILLLLVKNISRLVRSTIACFAFGLLASVAIAQEDVFRVSTGQIEATEKTEVLAKERAFDKAKSLGWQILFSRLTLANEAYIELNQTDINNLLQSFSIRNEKFGGNVYRAHFELQFSRKRILELFRSHKIDYAEQRSPVILIIPALKRLGTGQSNWLLFEPANHWLQSWANAPIIDSQPIVPYVVPFGDATDIAIISEQQIRERDPIAFSQLAQKYNATALLFSDIELSPAASDGTRKLTITLEIRGTGWDHYAVQFHDVVRTGETEDHAMTRAITKTMALLNEQWKNNHLIAFGKLASTQQVIFQPETLPVLLQMRDKIQSIARVSQVDINSVSIDRAILTLTYHGFASQLKQDLTEANMNVSATFDHSHSWILELKQSK